MIYQEQPIQVDSFEDFTKIHSNYTSKQKFQFKCENCKKLITKNHRYISESRFLCRSCSQKKSMQEKYGVSHNSLLPSFKLKIQKTYLKKSKEELEKINQKRIETCKERYGVEHVLQSQEFSQKASNTWKTKTTEERERINLKRQQTCESLYGRPFVLQDSTIRQKIQNTLFKNHGVTNPSFMEDFKERCKKTNQAKRGVDWPMQDLQVQKKSFTKYTYQNQSFDSSWELAIWIYCKDHNILIEREPISIEYEFEGQKHRYFPDFLIDNQLVEIKSVFYTQKPIEIFKLKVAEQNNVKILFNEDVQKYTEYVKQTYGSKYLKSFKN